MSDAPGLDPAALGDDAVRTVREMLAGLGCTVDELDAAEREGTLPLLAVERLMVPEVAEYDLAGVAARTGLDVDTVRQLWRTLGYPVPRDDEVAFTAADVEIMTEVGRLMAGDVASADLVLQMSRVIGSSMARIASSQVDVISARVAGAPRTGALADTELTDEQIVVSASALLPIVPSVLTATWRRHLQGAIRRRLSIAEAGQGQLGVVGFADLVGFTALSQQVGDDELAAIVDEFEQLAFDVVTANGGPGREDDRRRGDVHGRRRRWRRPRSGWRWPRAPAAPTSCRTCGWAWPTARCSSARATSTARWSTWPAASRPSPSRARSWWGRRCATSWSTTTPTGCGRCGPARSRTSAGCPLWVLRRAAPAESRFAERRRALRDAVKARVEPS